MAITKLVKTSNSVHVAFGTELTVDAIKCAKIANLKALSVFEDDKKVFEFDLAPRGGFTVLSRTGVVVEAPTNKDMPISTLFDVTGEDEDAVRYVAAVVLGYMDTIEKQVAAAVKEVKSVKVAVEEI